MDKMTSHCPSPIGLRSLPKSPFRNPKVMLRIEGVKVEAACLVRQVVFGMFSSLGPVYRA
jgi:hypothetical protein